jgi:hypothetical protein
MFDEVIEAQRPLWDVYADICAAGRASPTRRDGLWSVVIDKANATIAQMFTPHNSWGFSGVRALPQMPHAFRVQFKNAEKGYQPDERLVYNDGYTSANATLIEGMQLPGVTTPIAIHKHARFHFAQLKLRPETYTFSVDWEHIICTRGDRVQVSHHLPLWGLGTGRIEERIDGTHLRLSEQMPMDAGTTYGLRIRLEDGTFISRQIVPAGVDGYYDTVELTVSVNATQGLAGNLVSFGLLNEETVDLIVQSIEPNDHLSASISCVDYAPAVFDSDDEVIPEWDSQITLPPRLHEATITAIPVVTNIVSDESVMERNPSGGFIYGMRVSWTNPNNLPRRVNGVQAQIDFQNAKIVWQDNQIVPLETASVTFMNLKQGSSYVVRLRYIDRDGRTGPWVLSDVEEIVGKTTAPFTVSDFTDAVQDTRIELTWTANPEVDVTMYECRLTDADWGEVGYLFRTQSTSKIVSPGAVGTTRTWYIKARDAGGLYSTVAASTAYSYVAPTEPSSLTASYHDTSTTSATVTFNWDDSVSDFGIHHYLITLTLPDLSVRTVKALTSEWTTKANWVGSATLRVKAVDNRGSDSTIAVQAFVKSLPPNVASVVQTAFKSALTLDWPSVAKTTLPIGGYEIRSTDSGWGSIGFLYRGAASKTTLTMALGSNTYYLRAFDTDGNYSNSSLGIGHTYDLPPTLASVTLARRETQLKMVASAEVKPADFAYYEFRILLGGAGDVYATATEFVQSLTRVAYYPLTALGTYRVSVRMVDQEGNTSAASASASVTIATIPAP